MTKKLITLLLALTMVFACAVPVVAVSNNSSGTYTQTTIPTVDGTFSVKLNIQGYGIDDGTTTYNPIQQFNLDVDMGSADAIDASYTVEDVLNAAAIQYADILAFNIITDDDHGQYLYGVKDINADMWFVPKAVKNGTKTYFCGWMFRINGQMPMLNSTDGASIDEAYVGENYVVDVFYANPYDINYSTAFTQVIYDTITSSGAKRFQVLYSNCYYANNNTTFTVTNFAPAAYQSIQVIVDGTTLNVTTNSNGKFALSGLSSGTHTMKVVFDVYNTFTDAMDSTVYYDIPEVLNTYNTFTF